MGWLAVLVMDDMQRFLSKPALTFFNHWWTFLYHRCIVLCAKKGKIYARYLAYFCIDWCRITFPVHLSLRDITRAHYIF